MAAIESEPVENSAVVARRNGEGFCSKMTAFFKSREGAVVVEDTFQICELGIRSNNKGIGKVLAAARMSEMPPISIFSIISCSEAPEATVASKG